MISESRYSGQAVLITGGAGGLGTAMATAFAHEGARVMLADHNESALGEAGVHLAEAGIGVQTTLCDVTDADACRAAVAATCEAFGRLDVLVNNAGLTHVSAFADTHVAVYRRVMDVNFFGALHMTQAALPHLRSARGRIVVMSSIAGFAPLLARTGYCASKHALHGCFDTLRAELRPEGVSVTLVCPSFVDTHFARAGLGGDGAPLHFERATLGRLLTPGHVAAAVCDSAWKRRARIILSPTGKLAWWVSRLAPAYYERAMARRFARELLREEGRAR